MDGTIDGDTLKIESVPLPGGVVNHCEFTARKTTPLVLNGQYDCTGNFHAAGSFSVTRCSNVATTQPASTTASASSNNPQPSLNAAVVRIRSEKALGSGFFVTDDLVATNSHVVHGSRQVWMSLSSGDEHLGTVAYENRDLDFALVRSSVRGTPLPLRNSPLSDGEGVVAVGFPQGRHIAALSTGTVHKIFECCIEHDALIAGGSSGGPLVDQNMQVIGINTALSKAKGDKKNETDRTWALKMGYIAESLRQLNSGPSAGGTFESGSLRQLATSDNGTKQSGGEGSVPISADYLTGQYLKNAPEADQRWKGTRLTVFGTIAEISAANGGSRYIQLRGSDGINVQCSFAPNRYSDYISGVAVGQEVTLRGDCHGRQQRKLTVILGNCEPML